MKTLKWLKWILVATSFVVQQLLLLYDKDVLAISSRLETVCLIYSVAAPVAMAVVEDKLNT